MRVWLPTSRRPRRPQQRGPDPITNFPSVEVGDWWITALSDGTFRLDGGSMFGVVPKVMWEPLVEVDDKNRIELALRPFLAEGPGGPILIESGIGRPIRNGALDPADYEQTVKTLLSAVSEENPAITKEPEGAWTHEITDEALN